MYNGYTSTALHDVCPILLKIVKKEMTRIKLALQNFLFVFYAVAMRDVKMTNPSNGSMTFFISKVWLCRRAMADVNMMYQSIKYRLFVR